MGTPLQASSSRGSRSKPFIIIGVIVEPEPTALTRMFNRPVQPLGLRFHAVCCFRTPASVTSMRLRSRTRPAVGRLSEP